MYKVILCVRYLFTRYIALASVVSVMLGVATMIVVNSVMSGFTSEMQNRLHGILGDLSVEAISTNGFPDASGHMKKIQAVLGDDLVAQTPLCATAGIINYKTGGRWRTQEVIVVGIDEHTKGEVGEFCNYLQHPANREHLSFNLRDGGYDTYDHQVLRDENTGLIGRLGTWMGLNKKNGPETGALSDKTSKLEKDGGISSSQDISEGHSKISYRYQMEKAGWEHRRERYSRLYGEAQELYGDPEKTTHTVPKADVFTLEHPQNMSGGLPEKVLDAAPKLGNSIPAYNADTVPASDETGVKNTSESGSGAIAGVSSGPSTAEAYPEDPFSAPIIKMFDPLTEQHSGAIVGIGLSVIRHGGEDCFLLLPGDDFKLTFPTSETPPTGITDNFTCVDLYESKMSEYDGRFMFIPLSRMQELRGMADPTNPTLNRVNQIQIKMKAGVDLNAARDKLRAVFDPMVYDVMTWQDRQIALLQAVQLEIAILNVLLFMIIAVSGFGILAIFFMVVVEKTRDIGILKALGASSWGVMSIFLMYGLSLGIVGAGMGLVIGLIFVLNINEIADLLSWALGQPIFDPDIYYFYSIPYDINPWTVTWIVAGALLVAIFASILPAWRAASLQPVDSLRYE